MGHSLADQACLTQEPNISFLAPHARGSWDAPNATRAASANTHGLMLCLQMLFISGGLNLFSFQFN